MSQKYTNNKKKHRQQKSKLMPILFIAGGVILLIFALQALRGGDGGGSKVPVEVKGAPGIKVDKEKVDLGDVKLGKTVDVSFEISNVGDQPLRFSEAPYIEVLEGC